MRLLIAVLAGFAALVGLFMQLNASGDDTTAAAQNRDAKLKIEREAMLNRATVSGLESRKELLCAADQVSPETAETIYLSVINRRADLVDPKRTETASRDAMGAFEKCGIGPETVSREMDKGPEFMQAFAIALLERGR